MFDVYDITEADEAATTKERALSNYLDIRALYHAGEETMGVLAMYERAAWDMGLSCTDLDVAWCQRINHD